MSRWLVICLCLPGCSLLLLLAGTLRCRAADDLVVEARWRVTCCSTWSKTKRRLIAWQNGNLYLSHQADEFGIKIERVVSGSLPDERWLDRPVGVNLLYVLMLNDAALAMGSYSKGEVSGRWRLTRLPDGSYAVLSIDGLPAAVQASGAKAVATMQATAGKLKSKDPKVVARGLQEVQNSSYFHLIPAIIPLVDQETKTTVPMTTYWDGPHGGGHSTGDAPTTIGEQAYKALLSLGKQFYRFPSAPERTSASWQKWWEEILATPAFPVVQPAPGPLREIARYRTNQSSPDYAISPDGTQALVTFTRLEKPVKGPRSGIQLIDIQHPEASHMLYQVPEEAINQEPDYTTVAWDAKRVGVAFFEWEYDDAKRTVRFLAADLQGQALHPVRTLGLRDASSLAICADGEGWLLAYVTSAGKACIQRLSPQGEFAGPAVPIAFPYPASKPDNWRQSIALVNTPHGPAVTCILSKGDLDQVYLALLDDALAARSIALVSRKKPVNDWFYADYRSTGLCVNGETLLVTWYGLENNFEPLQARFFNLEGQPVGGIITVAADPSGFAPPAALGNGFALAWMAYGEVPNQLYVATISPELGMGKPCVADADRKGYHNAPLALGAHDGTAVVLLYDRNFYPRPILAKEVELSGDK
ncbi:MAG: hypothetical protein ACYDCO_24305 [Armatimonadota bacterium]